MQAENDEIAHNDGHYKKGKSAASKTYKEFKQ